MGIFYNEQHNYIMFNRINDFFNRLSVQCKISVFWYTWKCPQSEWDLQSLCWKSSSSSSSSSSMVHHCLKLSEANLDKLSFWKINSKFSTKRGFKNFGSTLVTFSFAWKILKKWEELRFSLFHRHRDPLPESFPRPHPWKVGNGRSWAF